MKKKVSDIIADYARQIHQFLIKEDPFKQTIVSHETTNPWNRESESFVRVDRVFRSDLLRNSPLLNIKYRCFDKYPLSMSCEKAW